MDVRIETSWKNQLAQVFEQAYFTKLAQTIRHEYQNGPVYPPARQIFRAFDACPFESVKVVILGQDPYHGEQQANGLCFSVTRDVTPPPSLQNIFKELTQDLGRAPHADRTLEHWAQQGVLLLNSILTVRAEQAASHRGLGWEQFTDAVLQLVAQKLEHRVFILWGSYAQQKASFIDPQRHCILRSAHPSPLSAHRGFMGSRPFSRTNQYLEAHGLAGIDW